MKRTKLDDRILPTYTKGEEIFNMVSHIVGGALGITAIVLCVIVAALHNNVYGIISGIVFGTSLLILYTMSSIYHGLSPKLKAKKVFQIIDHCSIFLLIAGTYTPFALCTFRSHNPVVGWSLFGFVWTLAVIGITFNSIDIKKYKTFSMICYLLMGWCIIIKMNTLIELITIPGFLLVLSGGIIYSLGAIIYKLGKKHKWMHSIFHIFCLISSVLHLLCILFYVL